jgi:LSD1 subclass zinc finger protein
MDDFNKDANHDVSQKLDCTGCGAKLIFAPGTDSLKCQYCGDINKIEIKEIAPIEEYDFLQAIRNGVSVAEKHEISTVKCPSCGAQSTLAPNISSDQCAFCGTPLVVEQASRTSIIKPKSLLPFKITSKQAGTFFKDWLHGLWFAPNKLKKYAKLSEKLKGMYMPYWTYDSQTFTSYRGERGTNYTVQESYTDSDGNRQTRTVTKIRWRSVSGTVSNFFDDVLVLASNSLSRKHTQELEPWDLENLVNFDEQFLSGFQTEVYQIGLEDGFKEAKSRMEDHIRTLIYRDIGGDHQRISSMDSHFNDITFKHVLLPLWISAYRFNDKVYRFLVNARTGEVKGERPYSIIKITLAVLAGLALIAALYYFFGDDPRFGYQY